ncbi:cell cycle checkpoint protein RAD17-like isoform X3 [Panicum virgatum]|uniref:cell cycle checkpoint protein RAD17-like isoform X3 n=1 Tax=Panicum virgatum TaxID=38727 RepID=UPI0019D56782|nr:cell cycle checkpoint protein RAD17-like isoform X3 [Panicum virgatum]
MGKRPPVVVLSSSSGEDDGGGRRGPSARRSRTPASAPARAQSQAASGSRKKPRRESSAWRGRRRCSEPAASDALKAEFDMLSEDFSECFDDLGMSGSIRKTKELWVDKYTPRSLTELAVHKKKVEDVKKWLEEKLMAPKRIRYTNSAKTNLQQTVGGWTLVLTGQTGVGKSATVKAIAADLGADLCEWTTPVPTLWAEHLHANSGLRYISKLEEFENFVEKIRKYAVLRPTSTTSKRKLIIILIDDIPVTSGTAAFARLGKCLTGLIQSTQVPTVISLTHYHKSESNDTAMWNSEDLESLLHGSGAHKIAFNPVTTNSIKKVLTRICKEERYDAPEELLHQIAISSGGDIRHAIMSLQYYCLYPRRHSSALATSATRAGSKRRDSLVPRQESYCLSSALPSPCGRDETLTLFHALGKFLHNKRETNCEVNIDLDPFPLQEKLRRNSLKMDVPEKILSQAHGKVRTVADFLHENVLDFIDDEAVDDAWVVLSYLARGVLFGNAHVAPSRWHTIRSPKLWQAEQSFRSNKDQILKERFDCSSSCGSCNFSDIVTEFRPSERWVGPRNDGSRSSLLPHGIGNSLLVDKLDADGSHDEEDDVIEEC